MLMMTIDTSTSISMKPRPARRRGLPRALRTGDRFAYIDDSSGQNREQIAARSRHRAAAGFQLHCSAARQEALLIEGDLGHGAVTQNDRVGKRAARAYQRFTCIQRAVAVAVYPDGPAVAEGIARRRGVRRQHD